MKIHKFRPTTDSLYTYIQIYLTKEEYNNTKIIDEINKLKNKNTRVAYFLCGNKNYPEILKKIIFFEVEKNEEI